MLKPLRLHDVPRNIAITIDLATRSAPDWSNTAWRLLSAIVSQARLDGMASISIRVDPEHGSLRMRYFGPGRGDGAEWWEMVPPPLDSYPYMLRCVLAMAQLEPGLPVRGRIPVTLRRSTSHIRFSLETIEELLMDVDEECDERGTVQA